MKAPMLFLQATLGLASVMSTVATAAAATETPVRDRWYLDAPTPTSTVSQSFLARDTWYLESPARVVRDVQDV